MSTERRAAALFLDRDGVINVNHGYVHTVGDFDFIDGVFDVARAAHALGMVVVVVTNQAGIARGLYDEAQFNALTAWMCTRFSEEGAPITAVYHCPHHPEAGIGDLRVVCACRKPAPGMLLRAEDELGLDLGRSILIGDHATDIIAGQRAGVGTTILFGKPGPLDHDGTAVTPTLSFPRHADIAAWLSGHVR